jgi:hypothetical protein
MPAEVLTQPRTFDLNVETSQAEANSGAYIQSDLADLNAHIILKSRSCSMHTGSAYVMTHYKLECVSLHKGSALENKRSMQM